MAEINNLTEINENFDTIKTLLNSIRAQGILNTSDVDKLLTGINSKLEKINTDEDVDLIKVFLTELKQSLDERHSVLISKFGAIESLFSTLLKNSSEMLKSSEIKELFDIVATNLSVFSREVVSQKETLTDITLRLDAIQSDDTNKTEIIKNISVLKGDIDRISNGFDSIVLSLNENFKSVIKSISEIDPSASLTEFASQVTDVVNSSNTILSALQLLDKKQSQMEEGISVLATQDDINSTKRTLTEIFALDKQISDSVEILKEKNYKLDNLADKIDASVNIIAGLKAVISESDANISSSIINRLDELQDFVKTATSKDDFADIKSRLEAVVHDILNNCVLSFNTTGNEIKEYVSSETGKISQLIEVNVTRTLNDINANSEKINTHIAEGNSAISDLLQGKFDEVVQNVTSNASQLNEKLHNSHTDITELCQKNFADVAEGISVLKNTVDQIEENNVSTNNAIFSNITDRLAIFENSLKASLEKQEDFVTSSSDKVAEQMSGVQTLSGNLDYKLDSTIIEINNSKQEFERLKNSVQGLLDLDFINVIKDLKVDLYAVKQDLNVAFENDTGEISEKLLNDFYSKYELLIRKIDTSEDALKNAQQEALEEVKSSLTGISSSLVDILSYVSVKDDKQNQLLDSKIGDLIRSVNDSHLNYVESVRGIVDVIKVQVENNLEQHKNDMSFTVGALSTLVENSSNDIKADVLKSYDKLLEVQTNFDDIRNILSINNVTNSTNIETILNNTDSLKGDFEAKLAALKNLLLDKINEYKNEFTCENNDRISELKFNSESLHSKSLQSSLELKNELKDEIDKSIAVLSNEIKTLSGLIADNSSKSDENNKQIVDAVNNDLKSNINSIDTAISNLSKETTSSLSSTLAKILENFVSIKSFISTLNEQTADNLKENVEQIKNDFNELRNTFNSADRAIDEDLSRQISLIENNFQSLNSLVSDLMNESKIDFSDKISAEFDNVSEKIDNALAQKFDDYKTQIEMLFNNIKFSSDAQAEFIKEKAIDLNRILEETLQKQSIISSEQLKEISSNLKAVLDENIQLTSSDYNSLKEKLNEYTQNLANINSEFVNNFKLQIEDIAKHVDSGLSAQAQEINGSFDQINSAMHKFTTSLRDINDEINNKLASVNEQFEQLKADNLNSLDENTTNIINKVTELLSNINNDYQSLAKANFNGISELIATTTEKSQNIINEQAGTILKELVTLQGNSIERYNSLKSILDNDVKNNITSISDHISTLLEENSLNVVTQLSNSNSSLCEELHSNALEIKASFEYLNERLDKGELSQMGIYKAQVAELRESFNSLINEAKDVTRSEVSAICETLITNSKSVLEEVNKTFENKITSLLETNADISAGELQSIEMFATQILEQLDVTKQNLVVCKDTISNLVKEEIKLLNKKIENEADVISGDVIEQFEMFKDAQKDELTNLTTQIEGSVAGYIADSVNDLKSYFDIKADSSVLNSKFDNLKLSMEETAEAVTDNLNRLLELSVFSDAITDLKSTNEVLVNSMAEKLNGQIEDFIKINVTQKLGDRLNLFDKEFTDSVVDKYEDVKIQLASYKDSFDEIFKSVEDILAEFSSSKDSIKSQIEAFSVSIHSAIADLNNSFESLKSIILNKTEDHEYRASLDKKIEDIKKLVSEHTTYLEDISELCCDNLPEVREINSEIKYNIKKSISDLSDKIESSMNVNIEEDLNHLKSELITQIINIFNQISFITEQEEILDFIQDKHDELITVLSHIVTTSNSIESVKDNVAIVDNKIDTLKEDIDLINEKITSIMSSDGDINYVYSLQDLESDIANLRLVLNEMKDDDKYKDFHSEFESMAEDIVSISTRTNKLILASDESYKALQDSLQEFKLVINDLDERTRNFPQEAGIDRIDNKLGAINTMMQNEVKTNKTFNQIFEYLAEWVDRAGAQITDISDKVETLNDIGQIKVMLEDLKADSEDNTETNEMIDALSTVFEKQAKRINSLEAKLDRLIVENTINNKPKLDVTPFEDTLNRFLVAIDDKMLSQQRKISSLETKLQEIISVVDSNDEAAQLTKKIGGMDRQIAKLNKSIEKIASHVVEK